MRYPEEDEIMTNTTEYVIRCIAVECGITSSHTRGIIEEAIQRGVMSSDLALRREMLTRFGNKDPSAEEFIKEIAKMIFTAHHDE